MPCTISIIETLFTNLRSLKKALEEAGYTTKIAGRGALEVHDSDGRYLGILYYEGGKVVTESRRLEPVLRQVIQLYAAAEAERQAELLGYSTFTRTTDAKGNIILTAYQ